jgi:biopolymer transport protein ExbD
MRLELNPSEGNLGFQIAPMIDVVFVIMLFFMVMAGAVKIENELNTQLPGTAETSSSTDFVDEQIITISDTGEISLNDEPFDSAASKDLPKLKGTLMRLKQNADAAKTPAVVTIISDTQAKYSRTIDVLDALAVAKIDNVTFTVAEEEQRRLLGRRAWSGVTSRLDGVSPHQAESQSVVVGRDSVEPGSVRGCRTRPTSHHRKPHFAVR